MAGRSRYTEARAYLAGGSIALLLMTFAALAVQDNQQNSAQAAVDPVATTQQSVVPANQQSSLSTSQSTSSTSSNATQSRVMPHTRTRGS